MPTVAFLHAHPDDEAIFTGGTMARLVEAGDRVVVVMATGGELGLPPEPTAPDPTSLDPTSLGPTGPDPTSLGPTGLDPTSPAELPTPERIAAIRRQETLDACALLGVDIDAVHFLGYHDSGMAGDPANHAPRSLWSAETCDVAGAVAERLRQERADTLVIYDGTGIYGHPDHIQVHRAGLQAAEMAAIDTIYEATIDREYLHFVETHLVEEAILGGDLGMARSHLGVSSVEITTTVDVRGHLELKRAAMGAHASQIPETDAAFQLGMEQFSAVYGWEWFIRRGRPGLLDRLAI